MNFPSRRVFPEASLTVCVTFFTCGVSNNVSGTTDLSHTYSAAVTYLEAQAAVGSDLRYELVWVDNGGDAEDHAEFLARGAQFEVAHRNAANEGLFRAVNDVWFRGRGCRARYVLSLEDDRMPRPDLMASRVPHLSLAVELLQRDAAVVGVRLKDEWSDALVSRAAAWEQREEREGAGRATEQPATEQPAMEQPAGSRVAYARHCMTLSSGFVWGSFSMAAVMYDRQRLLGAVGRLSRRPNPRTRARTRSRTRARARHRRRLAALTLQRACTRAQGSCSRANLGTRSRMTMPRASTRCVA